MEQEPTGLEQAILKTLLWFSVFSVPLTVFEIWKWLMEPDRPYSLAQVYSALETSSWLSQKITVQGGFVAPAHVQIDEQRSLRAERFAHAERKYRALMRVTPFFSLFPRVHCVYAVNSLSFWAANASSDIDLFIVTSKGAVWSSRFWLVLPFLLLGQRPHHDHDDDEEEDEHQDPFCFSFFSDEEHLQLESLCLSRDYYMSFWSKAVVPVMTRSNKGGEFHELNRWSSRVFPHASPRVSHPYHRGMSLPAIIPQWSVFEPVFSQVQRKRFPETLAQQANLDSRVVVHDGMLKFHANDRREQFRDRFEHLLEKHL